ncbi:MAG: RNA pyrophosphohydrolase [Robiginitomaculum sp.]|nr:RNA pyrophosphohydrolase [Robiginitomaculum sp.]
MPTSPKLYRPAVGIALFNQHGKVFLGRRKNARGPYIWQMPQGGIDEGETPKQAAIRELEEETGIPPALISPIGEIDMWLKYDFPPQISGSQIVKKWRGQKQRWFAFGYQGNDAQIDLNAHSEIEFDHWRWDTLGMAEKLIVPFKRTVYEHVRAEFSKFET